MIEEESFGEKIQGVEYKNRIGAYTIIVDDKKRFAVVKTKKGYFLIGGGLDEDETHEKCIKRECLEEVGMSVVVEDFICKGGQYSWSDSVGYIYGIGYFYFTKVIDVISKPIEKDHELVWLNIQECYENMHLKHQVWAINKAFNILNNS